MVSNKVMADSVNRAWILKSRPEGMADPSIFELRQTPIPSVEAGQVLAKTLYLSFDPTQRAWMALDTYMPIVELGTPMRAAGIVQVVDSKHPKFRAGDLVSYLCGWQEYVRIEPDAKSFVPATKIPAHLDPAMVLALSLTGLTAYFGLLDVGKPKPGQTVLVSGAAGATGSIAAQVARLKGCKVIGIAGGPDKCTWLRQKARLDAAIDYKNEDVGERVAELCPRGVDVYFDNVGGPMLDAVLEHIAVNARIVICGAISQYNQLEDPYGIKNYMNLVIKRATAQGFLVTDYLNRALEGLLCLNRWVETGQIIQEIDMQHGFERVPQTLTRLFTGENLGKQLLKVADPPLPLRSSATEKFALGLLSSYMSWRKG